LLTDVGGADIGSEAHHQAMTEIHASKPSLMHRLSVSFGNVGRPLAGTRWFPFYSILRHTGRRSGTAYAIPVVALPTDDGYLIPLPFGERTQWLRNLAAAGGGGLRRRGRELRIADPQVVERDAVGHQLPAFVRVASRLAGIDRFVRVRRAD
jgi:deazaflavin-dependent oxidoreductase (nitroreductase family)